MRTLIGFFFMTFCAFAQINGGKVLYKCIENGKSKNTILIFNKEESLFYNENIKKEKKIDVNADNDAGTINLSINLDTDKPDNFGLYTNLKSRLIIEQEFLPTDITNKKLDTLFIKDKFNAINWELINDTKKINNYLCQKAIGNFRGREYTVWFTNDIPLGFGPWKLNGLPGLIIEAFDSTKTFYFYVEKIEFNTNSIINASEFLNKRYISPIDERKKYLSLIENIENQINQKIRASLPRGSNLSSSTNKNNLISQDDFLEINFDDI